MEQRIVLIVVLWVIAEWVTAPEAVAQTSADEDSTGGADAEETEAPGLTEHLEALNSPDPVVRYGAVVALGQLGITSVVPHLARVLRTDPNPDIRGWAVRSLAQIDNAEAREAIVMAAESDADTRVRELALEVCRVCAPSPFAAPSGTARRRAPVRQTRDRERARSTTVSNRHAEERRLGNSMLAIGVVLALTSIIPIAVAGGLSDRWEDCTWSYIYGDSCVRTSTFAVSMALFALGGLELVLSVIPMVLGARRLRNARMLQSDSSQRDVRALRPIFAASGRGDVIIGVAGVFF